MLATTLALLLVLVQAARAAPNGASPLKVFVLAGQSNMEGQAEVRLSSQRKLCSSVDAMGSAL
jgi:hypothetical protein